MLFLHFFLPIDRSGTWVFKSKRLYKGVWLENYDWFFYPQYELSVDLRFCRVDIEEWMSSCVLPMVAILESVRLCIMSYANL